jgi:hypothetical protein
MKIHHYTKGLEHDFLGPVFLNERLVDSGNRI